MFLAVYVIYTFLHNSKLKDDVVFASFLLDSAKKYSDHSSYCYLSAKGDMGSGEGLEHHYFKSWGLSPSKTHEL